MREELVNMLFEKYPSILKRERLRWGIRCGDGWFDIIDQAMAIIKDKNVGLAPSEGLITVTDVKEKYGGLTIYVDNGMSDEYINGVLEMAMAVSYRTCEICGLPGKPDGTGLTANDWIHTLCEKHVDERRKQVGYFKPMTFKIND